MTRSLRAGEKPEQISMRMPKDLASKVDTLKEQEGVDRSAIINKAVCGTGPKSKETSPPTTKSSIASTRSRSTPPNFAEISTKSYRTSAKRRISYRNSSANSRIPSTHCSPCWQKNRIPLLLFFLYCTNKYSTNGSNREKEKKIDTVLPTPLTLFPYSGTHTSPLPQHLRESVQHQESEAETSPLPETEQKKLLQKAAQDIRRWKPSESADV